MTIEELRRFVTLAEESVAARKYYWTIKSKDKLIPQETKDRYDKDTEELRVLAKRARIIIADISKG